MDNKGKTIEEMFSELEVLIREMNSQDISLEETFDKYSKGMELIKECSNSIDHIEKELEVLEENA